VKEAEGEVQVEVTAGGKRIIRKRKLPDHEDVTVSRLHSAERSWKAQLDEIGKGGLHNAVFGIPSGVLCSLLNLLVGSL
jgi:hypothetical protein